MSDLSRRHVLAVGGVTALGASAGCLGSFGDDEPEGSAGGDPDTDDESAGTVLGDVSIENLSGRPQTVNVIVEFGDRIEHWSATDLEGEDEPTGADLERNWTTEPGSFRVTARIGGDDGHLRQVTPARWNDPDCVDLLVTIDRDGGLRVYGDTAGGACAGETEDD